MLETPASTNLVTTLPEIEKKSIPWRRLLKGGSLVCLGGMAIAAGVAMIWYRFTHVVVDGALINGRIVRMRSPIDGKIAAFYARPGVRVKSGQVLARIGRSPQEEQTLLQLQGEVQANSEQLAAASQSLTFLQKQLQTLDNRQEGVRSVDAEIGEVEVDRQKAALSAAIAKAAAAKDSYDRYQQLIEKGVDVAIAQESVTQNQAALDAAISKATAAKAAYDRYQQLLSKGVDEAIAQESVTQNQAALDAAISKATAAKTAYDRYQQLLSEGVVSAQQVDQLKSEWETAEAEVRGARSALDVARMALNATENGVAASNTQIVSKQQIEQLKSEWENAAADVKQARSALEVSRMALNATEGGVSASNTQTLSKEQLARLKSEWENAEAEVNQARSTLSYAQTALEASKKGVAPSNQTATSASLLGQRTSVMQAIQAQSIVVNTLKARVESDRQRLAQSKSLYSDRQDFEVLAPFAGIVYSTDYEQGEQISNLNSLMTVLDCNELWVEAVLNANDVSSIDTQKPVSVQLAGYTDTFNGEVDVIQPISGFPVSSNQGVQEKLQPIQAQALLPSVSTNLVGQPLARVTVKIPPPPQYSQSQQFCGIGQLTRLTFPKKLANFKF